RFGRLGLLCPVWTAAASSPSSSPPALLLLLLLLVRLRRVDLGNIRGRRFSRLFRRGRLVFCDRGLARCFFRLGLFLARHSFGTFRSPPLAPLLRVSRRNRRVDNFLPVEGDTRILRLERPTERVIERLPPDLYVGWRTKPVEDA